MSEGGVEGASRTESGEGTSPGCVSGNSRVRRVRRGGDRARVRLAALVGRHSVPKGKTKDRILRFQLTLGGAHSSSDWKLLTRRKHSLHLI